MINPLNFTGPEFLVFYLVVTTITFLIVKLRIDKHEMPRVMPKIVLEDPYEIAMLREGEDEALNIAAFSLIDRGLISLFGSQLQTKNKESIEHARRDIEKAILKKYLTPGKIADIQGDPNLHLACFAYRLSLQDHKLVPTPMDYALRRKWTLLSGILVGGLGAAKLLVALSRGYTNVEFLLVIMGVFFYLLYKVYQNEKTALGERIIQDLKVLFHGLQYRNTWIKAGGKTNEAALLAAVFGIGALYAKNFPYLDKLFPKPPSSSGCSSSNCSSSSSCSSGCGGGGGGCGGCGS
jgi:uncharacterized protein (TIGR04222 family)